MLVPGQLVDDKYRIVRQLGHGGMGAVFEALHEKIKRRVAIKVIADERMVCNPDAMARFRREASLAGRIETQHIVQVMDTGEDPGTGFPYIAMELMTGEDLDSLVARLGPLPQELALRIVAQALLGLGRAHEAGVIHRDIKPGNIFLAARDAGEYVVKLLDFGIAKSERNARVPEPGTRSITQTGVVVGSLDYLSPEQAAAGVLDRRTDIWSLGTVLYKVLCGRGPHDKHESLPSRLMAICRDQPGNIQDQAPWIRRSTAAIVYKALQLEPGRRFQTANEWFDIVSSVLPDGWTIHERMLAPLQDQERTQRAARLSLTPMGQLKETVEAICKADKAEARAAQAPAASPVRPMRAAKAGPAPAQPRAEAQAEAAPTGPAIGVFSRLEGVYAAAGRWDALLELYRSKLTTEKRDALCTELHRRVARVTSQKLRNPERALPSALAALHIDSTEEETIVLIERLCEETGHWDETLATAGQWLAAEPNPQRRGHLARLLSRWHAERGHHEEAARLAAAASGGNPAQAEPDAARQRPSLHQQQGTGVG